MKEIFKYIIILLAMMPIASCVDDEKLFELDDFETGALPNLQRTDDDGGFIDFLNYESTYLEFTVDFSIVNSPDDDGFGKADPNTEYNDVASVQLEVLWQRSGQLAVSSEFGSPITAWPATITITDVADLVEAIPELADVESIAVGDVFTFVCSVTLADGRVLPAFVIDPAGNKTPGYSVNFSGTENNPGYDFQIAYTVSCSSNIIEGGVATYDLSTNVTSTCCGLPLGTQMPGRMATVTDLGNGLYEISDILAGHISRFGIDPEPIWVQDVCDNLSLADAAASVLSYTGSGSSVSLDKDTGVWTILFNNEPNAIAGEAVLTPQ